MVQYISILSLKEKTSTKPKIVYVSRKRTYSENIKTHTDKIRSNSKVHGNIKGMQERDDQTYPSEILGFRINE